MRECSRGIAFAERLGFGEPLRRLGNAGPGFDADPADGGWLMRWQLLDGFTAHRHAAADEFTAGLTSAELTSLRDLLRRLAGPDDTSSRLRSPHATQQTLTDR